MSGTTFEYTTTRGQGASTTGNVSGIYDMSGGAREYVSAYVEGEDANESGSNLVNSDSKYKDIYIADIDDDQPSNFNANSYIFGDAIYETSGAGQKYFAWTRSCQSSFPYSGQFFLRGGTYMYGDGSSIFIFDNSTGENTGYVYNHASFRPVLAVQND